MLIIFLISLDFPSICKVNINGNQYNFKSLVPHFKKWSKLIEKLIFLTQIFLKVEGKYLISSFLTFLAPSERGIVGHCRGIFFKTTSIKYPNQLHIPAHVRNTHFSRL